MKDVEDNRGASSRHNDVCTGIEPYCAIKDVVHQKRGISPEAGQAPSLLKSVQSISSMFLFVKFIKQVLGAKRGKHCTFLKLMQQY